MPTYRVRELAETKNRNINMENIKKMVEKSYRKKKLTRGTRWHRLQTTTLPPFSSSFSPWQAERLSEPPVLATYHQEHPDRTAQAKHVFHVRRQSRKRRAPSVVPETPSRPPSLSRPAVSAATQALGGSDGRVGVVDTPHLVVLLGGSGVSLWRLVCHDVEADYGP